MQGNYVNGDWQKVDLTNLGNLTKLKSLIINGYVGNLEFAKKLTNLENLTISTSANNFNELIKSLKDLQNLKTLELSGDQNANDLSAISNMKKFNKIKTKWIWKIYTKYKHNKIIAKFTRFRNI